MSTLKERMAALSGGNLFDLRSLAKHAAPDGGSGASADRTPAPGPGMETRPNLG